MSGDRSDAKDMPDENRGDAKLMAVAHTEKKPIFAVELQLPSRPTGSLRRRAVSVVNTGRYTPACRGLLNAHKMMKSEKLKQPEQPVTTGDPEQSKDQVTTGDTEQSEVTEAQEPAPQPTTSSSVSTDDKYAGLGYFSHVDDDTCMLVGPLFMNESVNPGEAFSPEHNASSTSSANQNQWDMLLILRRKH